MIIVGRTINEISINELEYILDGNEELMKFNDGRLDVWGDYRWRLIRTLYG